MLALLAAPPAGQEPPPARRRALLIGVTDFIAPAMRKYSLSGPANDVGLLQKVLEAEPFRLAPEDVVTLAGLPADEAMRPTRANIEREFRRLRDKARAGDQIVIFMAGHGSQQPANADPSDNEPDGLDEIFLPADIADWDRSAGRVANAIVDDDLRQWTIDIRNKGASLWLIVDACHSGTISRAAPAPNQRERRIPIEALVPAAALTAARIAPSRGASSSAASATGLDLAASGGDISALYAADMFETTPELELPDRDGPVHGLFTYTLASVLSQSREPLTSRELVQRVIDRYRAEGYGPTPAYEGGGLDRELLGERTAHDRPPFRLTGQTESGAWRLDAGSVHGLTKGSFLEVFPPPEAAEAGKSIGYVKVIDVQPTTATVEPAAFGKAPRVATGRLLAGSRARIKYHEFGSLRLKVALQQPVKRSGQTAEIFAVIAPRAGPRQIERALDSLARLSNGLAERVSTNDADWLVRVIGPRIVLVPAAGWSLSAQDRGTAVAPDPPEPFVVGELNDAGLADALADKIRRIARAVNLVQMSSYVDPDAQLQVRTIRKSPAAGDAASVKVGEQVDFVVRNTGTVALDVTVLYLQSDFKIQAVFPAADSAGDNRINPGDEQVVASGNINDKSFGWESVVAIGVESTLRHENFRMLAQESLHSIRSASDSPPSPLTKLLDEAMYGTRGQRGVADDVGRFAIGLTWLRVVK